MQGPHSPAGLSRVLTGGPRRAVSFNLSDQETYSNLLGNGSHFCVFDKKTKTNKKEIQRDIQRRALQAGVLRGLSYTSCEERVELECL